MLRNTLVAVECVTLTLIADDALAFTVVMERLWTVSPSWAAELVDFKKLNGMAVLQTPLVKVHEKGLFCPRVCGLVVVPNVVNE